MTKVAHYNEITGELAGFFDTDIHESIPTPNIEITDDEWYDFIENQDLRKVDPVEKKIVVIDPVVDIALEKKTAKRLIDNAAEAKRSEYITSGDGQAATYLEKAKQAEDYIKAGYPSDTTGYLLIQAEANATGKTPTDAANDIVATRNYWIMIMAQIEEIRRSAKIGIDDATTIEEVNSIRDTAIADIEGI